MTIRKKFEGELHALNSFDNTVTSRRLFNPANGCKKMECHVTTFTPGASMEEEFHEISDHVFYMISGSLEILRNGKKIGILEVGDSIYFPAGEPHQLRNPGSKSGVFMAITIPPF